MTASVVYSTLYFLGLDVYKGHFISCLYIIARNRLLILSLECSEWATLPAYQALRFTTLFELP